MLVKKIFNYMTHPKKWYNYVEKRILDSTYGQKMEDEAYIKRRFKLRMGYKLDLKNPKTFNEKLQWLKLYDRNPMYTQLVDKYAVKQYVAEKIGEEYIIPTLGVWDSFEQIDFDALPDRFVLKCTHDSGGLVICHNKSKLDKDAARNKIERSIKRNYYLCGREWAYKDVKPRIIAEQYMDDENEAKGLTDYKFFCFGGEARMLYVSQGLEDHATARISFYDLQGKEMPFGRSDYKRISSDFCVPENFDQMIEVANKLAAQIPSSFARVDLYSVNGKIYFSEITFSPCSGYMPFEPKQWDEILGSWIVLPEKP